MEVASRDCHVHSPLPLASAAERHSPQRQRARRLEPPPSPPSAWCASVQMRMPMCCWRHSQQDRCNHPLTAAIPMWCQSSASRSTLVFSAVTRASAAAASCVCASIIQSSRHAVTGRWKSSAHACCGHWGPLTAARFSAWAWAASCRGKQRRRQWRGECAATRQAAMPVGSSPDIGGSGSLAWCRTPQLRCARQP